MHDPSSTQTGSNKPSRRRAVAALATAALTAAVIVTGSGAASSASSAMSVTTDRASAVACTQASSITPPPQGIIQPRTEAGGGVDTAPKITLPPVCPTGQVPVVPPAPPGLPKGNPDLPKGSSGPLAGGASRTGHASSARSFGPGCVGVVYASWCYYYAGASDLRLAQGGGLMLRTERPQVVGGGHSLEEISVQGGDDYSNIIEMGWNVAPQQYGEADPHLFVFHWNNWSPSCYSCDWHQYSTTYYPGMNLSAFIGVPAYTGFVYWRGNWWGWFNDQWVGYFPGTLWNGAYQNSTKVQWFGEVATQNGLPPLTQMGNGRFAADPAASVMSALCDVDAKAWVCWIYDKQALYQTAPQYYTVQHTGFGQIRLGGPGK